MHANKEKFDRFLAREAVVKPVSEAKFKVSMEELEKEEVKDKSVGGDIIDIIRAMPWTEVLDFVRYLITREKAVVSAKDLSSEELIIQFAAALGTKQKIQDFRNWQTPM